MYAAESSFLVYLLVKVGDLFFFGSGEVICV